MLSDQKLVRAWCFALTRFEMRRKLQSSEWDLTLRQIKAQRDHNHRKNPSIRPQFTAFAVSELGIKVLRQINAGEGEFAQINREVGAIVRKEFNQ